MSAFKSRDEEDGDEGWHQIWTPWANRSKDLLACSWVIWCGFVTQTSWPSWRLGSESYNSSHSLSPQCSHTPCFSGVETASQPFVISGNKDLIIPFSEELIGDVDVCRSVCTQVAPQETSLLPGFFSAKESQQVGQNEAQGVCAPMHICVCSMRSSSTAHTCTAFTAVASIRGHEIEWDGLCTCSLVCTHISLL